MNIKPILSLLLLISSVISNASSLPKGCIIHDPETATLTLQNKTDALYFIQSHHDIDLFLVDAQQPEMTTKLSPAQWSVLAAPKQQTTTFLCVESKPGSEQRVSCKGLMTICEISPKQPLENIISPQWAVKDASLEEAGNSLLKQHIPTEIA